MSFWKLNGRNLEHHIGELVVRKVSSEFTYVANAERDELGRRRVLTQRKESGKVRVSVGVRPPRDVGAVGHWRGGHRAHARDVSLNGVLARRTHLLR